MLQYFIVIVVSMLFPEVSAEIFKQVGQNIDGDATGDEFGWSISLSANGAIVAVGALVANSARGHVRVYNRTETTWSQLGNDIEGDAAGDTLGSSVSLSANGSRMAVGAQGNKGYVRVYDWNGITWNQAGVNIIGTIDYDMLGHSVSLSDSGSRLAIGAPEENGPGYVRVYDWNGYEWTQVGNDINGKANGDDFGWAVSLAANGSRLAVGAWENDDNGDKSGHVRVYDWNGNDWTQAGDDIEGEATFDRSGRAVSLAADGSTLAIGAPGNDGHVRVYKWDAGNETWAQAGQDIADEAADESGAAVSLSDDGNKLAIGAPTSANENNNMASGYYDAGRVRVYAWDAANETWIKYGDDILGLGQDFNQYPMIRGDQLGFSLSFSGDGSSLAIGAPFKVAGHARVYSVCDIGYGMTSTGTCEECTCAAGEPPTTCDGDFPERCASCNSGYGPTSTDTCEECTCANGPKTTCDGDFPDKCTSCDVGYGMTSGNLCVECTCANGTPWSNCNGDFPEFCLACNTNYGLTSQNLCSPSVYIATVNELKAAYQNIGGCS